MKIPTLLTLVILMISLTNIVTVGQVFKVDTEIINNEYCPHEKHSCDRQEHESSSCKTEPHCGSIHVPKFYNPHYDFSKSRNVIYNSTPADPCANIGFEGNNFNGWAGSYGTLGDLNSTGFPSHRYEITHIADPADPIAGFPVVPPSGGGLYALKLGNSDSDRESESASYTFVVDSSSFLIKYQYAIVLEDPGHDSDEQPFFLINIYDSSGNLIPCGFYHVAANDSIPGFQESGDYVYKDWTTVSINLENFIGQTVTIEAITGDCALGWHAGYSYVDFSCIIQTEFSCDGMNCNEVEGMCEGEPLTLSAPAGFSNYSWDNGMTGQEIIINNAIAGSIMGVTVDAVSSTGEVCQFYFDGQIPQPYPSPLFSVPNLVQICSEEAYQLDLPHQYSYTVTPSLGVNCLTSNCTSLLFSPENTTGYEIMSISNDGCMHRENITIEKIGTQYITIDTLVCFGDEYEFYGILINNDTTVVVNITPDTGCDSIITLNNITNEVTVTFVISDYNSYGISCHNGNDGSIKADVGGGGGEYDYEWSTGIADSNTIDNLNAGEYTVTVTDATGCEDIASVELFQPIAMSLMDTVGNITVCHGDATGHIKLAVSNGQAPYSYTWSTGHVTSSIDHLFAGDYTVSVTDDNNCVLIENFTINQPDPISAEIIVEDVTCHGYGNGTIDVHAQGGVGSYEYTIDSIYQDRPRFEGLGGGTYTLSIRDSAGCDEFQNEIAVYEPVKVSIDAGPDNVTVPLGQPHFVNITTNVSQPLDYYSAPNDFIDCNSCQEIVITPLGNTTIVVEGTDENGCMGLDTIHIIVDRQRNVFIPNAFSPDGDGINDLFLVYGGVDVEIINSMKIFDRWGEFVFGQESFRPGLPEFGWDGSFRGTALDAGVFVYAIQVTFIDGFQKTYTGDITIIK